MKLSQAKFPGKWTNFAFCDRTRASASTDCKLTDLYCKTVLYTERHNMTWLYNFYYCTWTGWVVSSTHWVGFYKANPAMWWFVREYLIIPRGRSRVGLLWEIVLQEKSKLVICSSQCSNPRLRYKSCHQATSKMMMMMCRVKAGECWTQLTRKGLVW